MLPLGAGEIPGIQDLAWLGFQSIFRLTSSGRLEYNVVLRHQIYFCY